MEIWYKIPETNGRFVITKTGKIKSTLINRPKTGRKPSCKELKRYITRGGYYGVSIKIGNKRATKYLHRLLAKTFIPNPENKPCVNHKDSNRLNNELTNLEWCTYSENNKHAYAKGMQIRKTGETHNQSILNEKQVNEIRSKYKKNIVTIKILSNQYNVSKGAIQGILNRKTWKHI